MSVLLPSQLFYEQQNTVQIKAQYYDWYHEDVYNGFVVLMVLIFPMTVLLCIVGSCQPGLVQIECCNPVAVITNLQAKYLVFQSLYATQIIC